MKRILFVFSLMLSSVLGLAAQTFDYYRHPNDPDAYLVDTLDVHVVLASSNAQSFSDVINTVLVFRTSSNKHDYMLCLDSMRVTGDGQIVDGVSTLTLLNLISRAAVAQGVNLGYTGCSVSCILPDSARVYMPSCIKRNGSGNTTSLRACSSTASLRVYGVCCPSGTVTITNISAQGGGCPPSGVPGCESTTP